MAKTSTGDQPQEEQVQAPKLIDISDLAGLLASLQQNQNSISAESIAAAIRFSNSKGHLHQAHGLTVDEMKQIQLKQSSGTVEMIPANQNPKYLIAKHESHLMHFSTERPFFDSTGKRLSKPQFHMLTVKEFERMSNSVKKKGDTVNPENAFSGLKVTIYHDMREGSKKGAPVEERDLTLLDMIEDMNEAGLRKVYAQIFKEQADENETQAVLYGLIKERLENAEYVE